MAVSWWTQCRTWETLSSATLRRFSCALVQMVTFPNTIRQTTNLVAWPTHHLCCTGSRFWYASFWEGECLCNSSWLFTARTNINTLNLLFFFAQDKAQPESQAPVFGNVLFDARLAVDVPDAIPLVKEPGSDGFSLASAPLFQVSERHWLHASCGLSSTSQELVTVANSKFLNVFINHPLSLRGSQKNIDWNSFGAMLFVVSNELLCNDTVH